MCDVAIVLQAASLAVGAVNAFSGPNMSDYNAAVARNNTILAQQKQEVERRRISDDEARTLAMQRAAVGKSGIQFHGAPVEVFNDAKRRFDYQQALNRHDLQVRTQQIQQQLQLQQFQEKAARQQRQASGLQGLLGGASQLAGRIQTSLGD